MDGAEALFDQLGPAPVAAAAFGLALVGIATRIPREWRRNEIGVATAASVLLLVGLAAASQGSGLGVIHTRYVIALAPLVSILIVLGLWELGAVVRASEAARAVAAGALIVVVAPGVLSWASIFGENSAEVYVQQREVGLWLRNNTPKDALIALNDAGAIAYYSNRRVYDLVGLVTNDQARSFREGWGSVYESVERLPPQERPDYFAVFPDWFPFIEAAGDDFEPLFSARLDERRITGGDELIVYAARYNALDHGDRLANTNGQRIIDQIDVADLHSEDEHDYRLDLRQVGIKPGQPQAVANKVLDEHGDSAMDGGRVVTRAERFVLRASPNNMAVLRARVLFPQRFFADDGTLKEPLAAGPVRLTITVNGALVGSLPPVPPQEAWTEQDLTIPAALNSTGRLEIEISVGTPWAYESYHYWLLE